MAISTHLLAKAACIKLRESLAKTKGKEMISNALAGVGNPLK